MNFTVNFGANKTAILIDVPSSVRISFYHPSISQALLSSSNPLSYIANHKIMTLNKTFTPGNYTTQTIEYVSGHSFPEIVLIELLDSKGQVCSFVDEIYLKLALIGDGSI